VHSTGLDALVCTQLADEADDLTTGVPSGVAQEDSSRRRPLPQAMLQPCVLAVLMSGAGLLLACERVGFMPLSAHHVRASIAVSDLQKAVAFYEGTLGLEVLRSGPSANIADGSRVYRSGGGPALNVYQSVTAGKTSATLATWYVDDIDQIVDELALSGVEFIRYDQLDHDAKGITARAGGGRIAWFQDPDGNTFALEADI
jgi:catechol 2,3-dioxygenase-like lactoylglutathione lyase family enzyme